MNLGGVVALSIPARDFLKDGITGMAPTELEDVQKRIEELRRRDPGLRIFGAGKHRYQNNRLSPAKITEFEDRIQTPLPPEFREFLLEIGMGAGPYYGIWNPETAYSEMRDVACDYEAETGRSIECAGEFPLTWDDALQIEERIRAGIDEPAAERDWPCSGCLPICDQGCTFWSVLVLTGDFTGHVWDLACFVAVSGEWMPARRPTGRADLGTSRSQLPRLPSPPTFLQWYEGWIDQSVADLAVCGAEG